MSFPSNSEDSTNNSDFLQNNESPNEGNKYTPQSPGSGPIPPQPGMPNYNQGYGPMGGVPSAAAPSNGSPSGGYPHANPTGQQNWPNQNHNGYAQPAPPRQPAPGYWQQYPQQYPGYPAVNTNYNNQKGRAIASLVIGALSLLLGLYFSTTYFSSPIFFLGLSVVGVVLGAIEIAGKGSQPTTRSLALGGVISGSVGFGLIASQIAVYLFSWFW